MSDKTIDNLAAAFAGESQANRKYLAFAQKADKEGFPQAAKLFRAAAESETAHALKHLAAMGEVGATADNLQAAIDGETYEFSEMYPPMIEAADIEGNKAASISFSVANQVEKEHAEFFKKALDSLGSNETVEYYVCSNCGHVHLNEAPGKCPVCQWPASAFKKID